MLVLVLSGGLNDVANAWLRKCFWRKRSMCKLPRNSFNAVLLNLIVNRTMNWNWSRNKTNSSLVFLFIKTCENMLNNRNPTRIHITYIPVEWRKYSHWISDWIENNEKPEQHKKFYYIASVYIENNSRKFWFPEELLNTKSDI